MTRRILFLCTGNYYRSRFAELLFNAQASRLRLDWVADSRGLATESGNANPGAISTHVTDRLIYHGVAVDTPRFPLQVEQRDLTQADLIIALNETEHRPYLERHFPASAGRIEYWSIPDLDRASPDTTLSMIEREISLLIRRLSKPSV